jgi:hypothetical protein
MFIITTVNVIHWFRASKNRVLEIEECIKLVNECLSDVKIGLEHSTKENNRPKKLTSELGKANSIL